MEPITTEQLWSRKAMGKLWHIRKDLDTALVNKLDVLYKSRQKDSLVGKTKITYSLPKSTPAKLGFGRLVSKGFETFENEARGTLCQDYYYDIDVVNAHPTLLHQFARKIFGMEMFECIKFCENRDEYYAQISDVKDVAKAGMFRVLYGGKCEFPHLEPFKDECQDLTFRLAQHPDYQALMKACYDEKPDNPFGSFLSYVSQTEERKVMLAMREFFLGQGWSVDCLCYDGIMVRKQQDKILSATQLIEAEGHILDKTGYAVKLALKPFSQFDFSTATGENDIIDPDVVINDEFAAKTLAELVGDNLVSVDGELFCCLEGVWKSGEDALRSLIHLYSSQLIFKQEGKKGLKIIDYGGCERNIPSLIKQLKHFAKPGKQPIQFAYTLSEKEAAPTTLEKFLILVNLWTRGQQELTDYVLNWFAHMIQKPTENPGVMLIITGRKGCGKDSLADFIARFVVGRDLSKSYNSTEQFFDRYDSKHRKIFLRLEEANRFVCLKNQDLLKSFITSETLEVNEKHKSLYSTPNYCRFLFTTNKENPVAFTEQERRFVILPCSAEKIGDIQFWTQIREELFTEEGGKIVGEFLESRPIESFNPRIYPVSAYQEEVIDVETSVEERFIRDWDGEKATASQLFEKYRDYCQVNSYAQLSTMTAFGKSLLKFIRDGKIVKKKTNSNILYERVEGCSVG